MDTLSADLALQAILGRNPDFVSGIDNEALDFSQLEDFINSEGSQSNNAYFNESLNSTPASGKLLNVIVENKRNAAGGHSLPESPPDSSSEHPYSPQEGCDPALNNPSAGTAPDSSLYMYKPPPIVAPMLGDGLILGSHMVVADGSPAPEPHLLEDGNLQLPDGRIIVAQNDLLLPDPDRQLLLVNEPRESTDLVQLSYGGGGMEPGLCEGNLYTDLQNVAKKRKLSQEAAMVKSEPEHTSTSQLSPPGGLSTSLDEEYASSEACLSESQYQCIRFNAFQQPQWHALCDQNLTELPIPHYRVDADKGFNFSNADDAFVCQKKNHFQITCHVQLLGDAQFVKTPDGFQKISSFHIHFYGVKHDCPTQTIRVEQSQSDRSKKPFHPVPNSRIELVNSQVTKVTVGRLHFSETTSNNMRKKGKPNPEQRYFQLVVGLHAHTTSGNFPIISHASQKIIVRASNPGQFESDVELCWQKGQTQDSIFHNGKVGVNTDRPDESLVIHGNIKVTGHIIQPSDIRAKKNIIECDTAEQLRNVQRLRVVKYDYEPSFATQLNREMRSDTGVIAQEVAKILPEAVRPAGDLKLQNGTSIPDFLVVNKERIFMENIGAVKELCRVTDNLETRIDNLEKVNRKLKLKRGDSLKSTSTVSSVKNPTSYPAKCPHRHCDRDEELCSNKFIQIIIVILVLIMAFCLAAITTLYLLEASRHRHLVDLDVETPQHGNYGILPNNNNILPTKQLKPSKTHQSRPPYPTFGPSSGMMNGDSNIDNEDSASPSVSRRPPPVGRPRTCLTLHQDLTKDQLCQIYCCQGVAPLAPPEALLGDKNGTGSSGGGTSHGLEKGNGGSAFHSTSNNEIDKRQKRDTLDFGDSGVLDTIDDQVFQVAVEGNGFKMKLTQNYFILQTDSHNLTYSIPISKYMPDDSISLQFKSTHDMIKQVEFCNSDLKTRGCLSIDETTRHKVNEHNSSQVSGVVIFEVNMADFQSKVMTYRAPMKPTQNACKLTNPSEFIEFNFHFYRHCDE